MNDPCLVQRGQSAVLAAALAILGCRPGSPADEIPLPALAHVDPDVVEAITSARETVAREPQSGEAWGRLGDRYFVHDFMAEAAKCYSRAEALDPGRSVWAYRLGWSLVNSHPEQAVAPFERSLRAFDSYAPAHEAYAGALVRVGRTDEAIDHFSRASELDPKAPHAETGLGLIRLSRGDLDAARAHLEEALARDEKHVEAHVGLAQVYLALGLEQEAKHHAELSRTLPQSSRRQDPFGSPDLPPAGARARTRFGKQLEKQGKHEEAAEQYRVALRNNPDYYSARLSLAKLLDRQGRRDEAIELLREAERLDPSFEQVRQDLKKLLAASGDFEESELHDE